ncbi:hypothetical protein JQC92_21350 [Shewanella sp. 202IG2-18]|uniref:type IV toxin-antitoxin system AbiEi family antitoxin n=1 Tax=Parashewanella hymeniacidonis TaxID=2807618 RepID=UPI0019616952|nr:hypothetical protein [Parashewanella hymeniacidonis]MBM7074531.1 hypothetical protein [Parashewanella hymeniacidonis]
MSKSDALISEIAKSVKSGGCVFDTAELAYMLGETVSSHFRKFLSSCVKKGVLERVVQGVYISTITPPDSISILIEIAKKLRPNVFSYISLESQLSHTGDISQIVMDRLTIVTKGRKGIFETLYGTIEFTHTKKKLTQLEERVYFDDEIKMFRASVELAIADLKACGRNLQMLDN